MAKKEKSGALTAVVAFLGGLVGFGCLIVGTVWIIRIIVAQWGIAIAGICMFAWPITLVIIPWYAGFELGIWWPLILIWGGSLVGRIFIAILEL